MTHHEIPTTKSHESDDKIAVAEVEEQAVPEFAYDPAQLHELSAEQMDAIDTKAWGGVESGMTPEQVQEGVYEELTALGFNLADAHDGGLVVKYVGIDGKSDTRVINLSATDFGTRIQKAELVAVEKTGQAEPADQEEVSDHEQSNQLIDALEDSIAVLAEDMREQVERSTKNAHIIDQFLDAVDNLTVRFANGYPSVGRETLGRLIDEAEEAQAITRLIDEAEEAQAITNREVVEAREVKLELKKAHDAVETLREMRTAEGVVLSHRTVSSSESIAMNGVNSEGAISDAKLHIDAIFAVLNELQYSQGHGYEEYVHRLRVHLNTVRPALSHHRALDRLVISDQNGLAELGQLLRDEKL